VVRASVREGGQFDACGTEVVACPAMAAAGLEAGDDNPGAAVFAAAVRRTAGGPLEEALARLARAPLAPLEAELVPGGGLARRVAVVATHLPPELRQPPSSRDAARDWVIRFLTFIEQLHRNLLWVVRSAGFRSLTMPPLCPEGLGIVAHLVAIGALQAFHRDFCEHPADPLQVRITCSETEQLREFNAVKDMVMEHLFDPELDLALTAALFAL